MGKEKQRMGFERFYVLFNKKKERIFRVFVCAGWVMCVVVFCSVVDKVKD